MPKGFSKTATESYACEIKTNPEKIKNRNFRKTYRFIKNGQSTEISGKHMKHRQPLKKERSQNNTGDY